VWRTDDAWRGDDVDHAGDGRGSGGVITGHHAHPYPGLAALHHGLGHPGARRVEEANEPQEAQPPLRGQVHHDVLRDLGLVTRLVRLQLPPWG
jgi:hypothetical protein